MLYFHVKPGDNAVTAFSVTSTFYCWCRKKKKNALRQHLEDRSRYVTQLVDPRLRQQVELFTVSGEERKALPHQWLRFSPQIWPLRGDEKLLQLCALTCSLTVTVKVTPVKSIFWILKQTAIKYSVESWRWVNNWQDPLSSPFVQKRNDIVSDFSH